MTPARNNVRATRHFGIPARKSSPSAPLQPFPREKTRPARPSNRSRAKKFAQQQPHLGQTAKKLSQRAQKHQNLAIIPEQGELFRVSNAAPPSRENFLPQLHHSIPITGTPPPQPAQNPPSNAADNVLSPGHESARGTKLSQHAHNQRKLAISHEQGEFFPVPNTAPPSRENFLPQQHHSIPITGTPPPQPAQNPPSNAADNALSPGHESTRGTKLSQHSHLKAQPVQNSPHNTRHKAQPVQNSPGTPKNNENWPFLASMENLFPFPTPRHRAGRIFSRNNTTQYPSQGHHHPTTTPTGRKLSLQHPPQGATGTKLSPQHPPQGTTDTKLSQHAHNQRKLAISRQQGEFFPVPNTAPPSRENFLPQQHHLGVYFNAADRLVPTFTPAPDQCTPQLGLVRIIDCSS